MMNKRNHKSSLRHKVRKAEAWQEVRRIIVHDIADQLFSESPILRRLGL